MLYLRLKGGALSTESWYLFQGRVGGNLVGVLETVTTDATCSYLAVEQWALIRHTFAPNQGSGACAWIRTIAVVSPPEFPCQLGRSVTKLGILPASCRDRLLRNVHC